MRQNRVDPWGELQAVASRGLLMGNRGILHDDSGVIQRRWSHKYWVTCVLRSDRVQPRAVFEPGRYSQLFFLDEATALAAGHRPCHYCQRERSVAIKSAWIEANIPSATRSSFTLKELDDQLQRERVASDGGKLKYSACWSDLPNGSMFERGEQAWLVSLKGARPWSFSGYGAAVALPADTAVQVLTPKSIVAAMRCSFDARLHLSAGQS